jgi:hypothetical protein
MGFISADGLIQSEIVVAAHGLASRQTEVDPILETLAAPINTTKGAAGPAKDYRAHFSGFGGWR